MKKIYIILFVFICSTSRAQLVSYEKIDSFTVSELQQMLNDIGFENLLTPEYPVDLYRVLHQTEFFDSTTVISGVLAVPRNIECKVPLISYQHGTSSHKFNAPSYDAAERFIAIFYASIGNTVCASDYIGLGASTISLHPYMHGFSQAHSTINLMRSVRMLQTDLNIILSNQLFLFGYSQGGFATAMTSKYIEQDYSDEFKVTAQVPMSGPYNMYGVQYDLVKSNQPYATPGYLPYLIFSYNMMYGNLFDSPSEVFKSPYDTLMPQLLFNHPHNIDYVSSQSDPVPINMIKDSVRQAIFANEFHPFRLDLLYNDLLSWTPKTPTLILYCEGDEQVNYRNAQIADSVWNYNGAPDVASVNHGDFSHADCLPFALLRSLSYFESKINNGVEIIVAYNDNDNQFELSVLDDDINDYDILWANGNTTPFLGNVNENSDYSVTLTHKTKGCSNTKSFNKQTAVSIVGVSKQEISFKMYPNPAQKSITIAYESLFSYELQIFDLLGKLVYTTNVNTNINTIDLSALQSGIYFVEVKGTQIKEKLIIE